MKKAGVWILKRQGKKGVSYCVRWIEPVGGACRGKTFSRSVDARMFQAKMKNDLETGSYFMPSNICFDEWVRIHLENMRNSPDDLSKKTILGHEEGLKALRETCKPKKPSEISPKMIRLFRQRQIESGLHPRTVNKRISAIRSALSYAVRDEIIEKNPLLGPHRLFLRTPQKKVRTLEVGEAAALFCAAKDLRHKAAISLAYYNGFRRNEIAWLKWADVDFAGLQLNIVSRDSHKLKTRRSRSVAMRPETADLLGQLAQMRETEYVFDDPGTFYWSVERWFPKLAKSAGVENCGLQTLRATCNTVLQDEGASQAAAMQILGHTSANVNRVHYTGTLTKQQRAVVNLLPSIG